MLLTFDVGNSNIVVGVFQEKKLIQNWRFGTDSNKSADEYGMMITQLFAFEGLNLSDVEDIIISTVVPSSLFSLQHASRKYFGKTPIIVDAAMDTGIEIKYDNPSQVGADRIVNAVAAREKYKGALIVIDMGTATTFCAITEKGEYLGGAISPGLLISSQALFEKTAKLPKVQLDYTEDVICTETSESIKTGVIMGHMGAIEYIVKRMKKELETIIEPGTKIHVIATGGMASLIAKGTDCIDRVDKMLTLEGLRIIHERVKNKKI